MRNKNKGILLVFLIIIVIVFLAIRNQKAVLKAFPGPINNISEKSGNENIGQNDDFYDQIDQEFNQKCEKGEWVKIGDPQGNEAVLVGFLRWIGEDSGAISENFENGDYYLDGSEKIALVNQSAEDGRGSDMLGLFENREVEVQGIVKKENIKEMTVSQIRCAGKEIDQNVLEERSKMLNYISTNIESIVPEKAPYKKWSVDSAIIFEENSVYVDFYDIYEDENESVEILDTMHRVLLDVKSSGENTFEVKIAAYYVPGEDGYILKRGTDKFKDLEEEAYPFYYFDSEENSWTRE